MGMEDRAPRKVDIAGAARNVGSCDAGRLPAASARVGRQRQVSNWRLMSPQGLPP